MKLTRFLSLALGLTLSAAAADETLYTGAFWTEGVNETGGWYDANKIDNSDGDADDNMCYAASAANIIAWWQNGEIVSGSLSSNAPKQLGDIWQTLIDANDNEALWDEGGESLSAINWWVSGIYCPDSYEDEAAWARYYTTAKEWGNEELLTVTLHDSVGYYFDRYGLTQKNLAGFLMDMQQYSERITDINFGEFLQNGCAISLGIAPTENEDAGHAITLWGVEYDEEGKLTTMWITDSDDDDEKLVKVSVTVDEENDKIWLSEGYNEDFHYYLMAVYAVNVRESYKWSTLSAQTYVNSKVNPKTRNGYAGAALLTDAFINEETDNSLPEDEEGAEEGAEEISPAVMAIAETTPDVETEVETEGEADAETETALESVISAMDEGNLNDRDAAALAGASTTVLGQALSGDMDRQLSAIRNRATMGSGSQDAVVLDGKSGSLEQPGRFFAWVNAEGNRAEQNNDGSAAGYTLSSWGGTLGAGMQVNDKLSLGLALTAMHGDLKSDGPDTLDGDMGTAYLSAFARYQRGSWSHSFIGSTGAMEADYNRYALGCTHEGDTKGTAIGLMYELSHGMQLSNNSLLSPVFNIAYRHTSVDAYNETGSDAALSVGEQELDTVTVALGARYAATVGQQTLNRACAFDARALVKYDLGDTQSEASVGFQDYTARANIESAERGALGLELGAGIAVPVGPGSIFTDAAVELRSDYMNFNAAAGYKIQF